MLVQGGFHYCWWFHAFILKPPGLLPPRLLASRQLSLSALGLPGSAELEPFSLRLSVTNNDFIRSACGYFSFYEKMCLKSEVSGWPFGTFPSVQSVPLRIIHQSICPTWERTSLFWHCLQFFCPQQRLLCLHPKTKNSRSLVSSPNMEVSMKTSWLKLIQGNRGDSTKVYNGGHWGPLLWGPEKLELRNKLVYFETRY